MIVLHSALRCNNEFISVVGKTKTTTKKTQNVTLARVVYTKSVRVRVRVQVKCGCGAGENGSAGAVRVKM